MGRLRYRLGLHILTAARSWEKIRKALNGEEVSLASFLTLFSSLTTIRLRRFSSLAEGGVIQFSKSLDFVIDFVTITLIAVTFPRSWPLFNYAI